MNRLLAQYPQQVKDILAKYPPEHKRSAVMPLLYLAQGDKMHITRQDLTDVGEICGMTETEVESIVGFYTLYHEEPGGKFRIQVCTDLPCALRGADEFYAGLCERLGVEDGGTTEDGLITVEQVKCLAACHRAPMLQVQSGHGLDYHENLTVDLAMEIIDGLRQAARTEKKEAQA